MKIEYPEVIHIMFNNPILEIEDAEIRSFDNGIKDLTLRKQPGVYKTYTMGNKVLWFDGKDSLTHKVVRLPGTSLALPERCDIVVLKHPEDSYWSAQDIAMLINTFHLKEKLENFKAAAVELNSEFHRRSVNAITAATMNPGTKILDKLVTEKIDPLIAICLQELPS